MSEDKINIELVQLPEVSEEDGSVVQKVRFFGKLTTEDGIQFIVPVKRILQKAEEEKEDEVKEEPKAKSEDDDDEDEDEEDEDEDDEDEEDEEKAKMKEKMAMMREKRGQKFI